MAIGRRLIARLIRSTMAISFKHLFDLACPRVNADKGNVCLQISHSLRWCLFFENNDFITNSICHSAAVRRHFKKKGND